MINKKSYYIALTGNCGSGKTTMLNILKELSYCVIDLDLYSVNVIIKNKNVINKIESIMHETITTNGIVDLKKVGDFFENHISQEKEFEEWYQLFLGNKIKDLLLSQNNYKLVFVDVPFLEQKRIVNLFDIIWIIEADEKICYERIKRRNNYDDKKINYLIKRSLVDNTIRLKADKVISNNGTIEELKNKVKIISSQLANNL